MNGMMNGEQFAAWLGFAHGHWQTDPPAGDGRYPVADREGNEAGFVIITVHNGIRYQNGKTEDRWSWKGWWWSEPLPTLGRPPAWPWHLLSKEEQSELLAQRVRELESAGNPTGIIITEQLAAELDIALEE